MLASALSACYACDHDNEFANLPRRDHIIVERGWISAHVINCALPGWLVLLPLGHVEKLHELSAEEASALGDLRTRLSSVLVAVTSCTKTYVVLFAEAPGFTHLHSHLVPRMSAFRDAQVGVGIFDYLSRPEAKWVTAAERDDIARQVRAALEVIT